MLKDELHNIYNKLRIRLSQAYEDEGDNGSDLTSVEKSSMETIAVLDRPTVAQFAKAMHISAPNAAYRVASLVKKGYLKKNRSTKDLRTYFLVPTRKYMTFISSSESYISDLAEKIKERFPENDYNKLLEMLTVIDKELMPTADLISKGGNPDATDEGIKADD